MQYTVIHGKKRSNTSSFNTSNFRDHHHLLLLLIIIIINDNLHNESIFTDDYYSS